MAEAYVANVHLRWRNRITGAGVDAPAGTILTMDDGDFDEPGARPQGALRSLAHALQSGALRVFDPSTAGDPDHMSRDEMLHWLQAQDVRAANGEPLRHNADAETLRALVRDRLQALSAPPTPPATARTRPRRPAEEV